MKKIENIIDWINKNNNLIIISTIIGLLIKSFIEAWDNQYRVITDPIGLLPITDNSFMIYFRLLNLLRLFLGYWHFYIIHIIFYLSFFYVGYKLHVHLIWILLTLFSLPILRFGVWDYSEIYSSFYFLFMVWIYYLKMINKKKTYYFLSIIGCYVKEYCLYINLLFILITFIGYINEDNFKPFLKSLFCKNKLKNRIKNVLRFNKFEILLIICFSLYRTLIIKYIGNSSSFAYGMLHWNVLKSLITCYKCYFAIIMIFGYIWIILFTKKDWIIYSLVIIVAILAICFGMIIKLDKLGNLFIPIIFYYFGDKYCLKISYSEDGNYTLYNNSKNHSLYEMNKNYIFISSKSMESRKRVYKDK